MRRAVLCLTVVVLAAVGCRDDEPTASQVVTAPAMAVAVADSSVTESNSTVCRAYGRELALVQAQKDSGVADPYARQKVAMLEAVIADACR
jgi:uncharacterized lipoprotein NlpE involved in copper resistance